MYMEINERAPAFVITECAPACLDTGVWQQNLSGGRDHVMIGPGVACANVPFVHQNNPQVNEECVNTECVEVRTRQQTISDGLTARLRADCCHNIDVPPTQETLLVGECVREQRWISPFHNVQCPNIVGERVLPETLPYAVGLSRQGGRAGVCWPELDENSLVCKRPEMPRPEAIQTVFTHSQVCAPDATPRSVDEMEGAAATCRSQRTCVLTSYYEVRDCPQ